MKKGLNETRLGAEPIQQLNTNSFINADSALSNSGQKDVKEHPKRIRQFHIPDFIENTVNQFAQGSPIIFLAAYPLQQDITGKDQGRAADSQVIADAMEFLAQFKQRFADLEAAFDRPAIAVLKLPIPQIRCSPRLLQAIAAEKYQAIDEAWMKWW